MRLVVLLGGWLLAGLALSAPAGMVDRDAVFARAREIAAAMLPDVAAGDLAGFRIAYVLTLLPTGNPEGGFEVDLLLRSSRSVMPAEDVITVAEDTENMLRLESLLRGAAQAWHYRTVRVRFAETGAAAPTAEFSSLLLNRDPELPPEAAGDLPPQ